MKTNKGRLLVDRVFNPLISKWSAIQTKMITRIPCSWRMDTRWINHFKKIRIISWLISIKFKLNANWSAYTVRKDTKSKRLSVLSCCARGSNISRSSWRRVRNERCEEQPLSHSGRRSLSSNFGTSFSAKQIYANNRSLLMQMRKFVPNQNRFKSLRRKQKKLRNRSVRSRNKLRMRKLWICLPSRMSTKRTKRSSPSKKFLTILTGIALRVKTCWKSLRVFGINLKMLDWVTLTRDAYQDQLKPSSRTTLCSTGTTCNWRRI